MFVSGDSLDQELCWAKGLQLAQGPSLKGCAQQVHLVGVGSTPASCFFWRAWLWGRPGGHGACWSLAADVFKGCEFETQVALTSQRPSESENTAPLTSTALWDHGVNWGTGS